MFYRNGNQGPKHSGDLFQVIQAELDSGTLNLNVLLSEVRHGESGFRDIPLVINCLYTCTLLSVECVTFGESFVNFLCFSVFI